MHNTVLTTFSILQIHGAQYMIQTDVLMFSFHDLSDVIFCLAIFRRCWSVNITSISQHPPPGDACDVWQERDKWYDEARQMLLW